MAATPDSDNSMGLVYVVAPGLTASPASEETAAEQARSASTTLTIPDRLEDLTVSASVWTRALAFEHDRLHGRQQLLGYPVVAITAVTGLAAFTQLGVNPAWWATLTVAIIAGIASVLAALQTHGDFATRAQTAADYSQKFGDLLGKMLEAAEKFTKGSPPSDEDLNILYADYATLRAGRPSVQPKLYEEAQEAVRRHLDLQKGLAETRER